MIKLFKLVLSPDNLMRKKPGRGEVSKKATCFDKLLKWTLLGLQGRKLFAILGRPVRFKSIIIGNCSLATNEQDKETFRRGFEIDSETTGGRSLQDAKSDQHETSERTRAVEESAEEPKSKKLKSSEQSNPDHHSLEHRDDKKLADEKVLKKGRGEKKHCEDTGEAVDHPSSSLFEPTKPDIYFSDTFVNEMFIRKDGKKPQDKSVVYFLVPKEEPKEEQRKEHKEESKGDLKKPEGLQTADNTELLKEASESLTGPESLTEPESRSELESRSKGDHQAGGQDAGSSSKDMSKSDASDQEASKVNNQRGRLVGKPNHKDEYRLECIQDGRKLGSTMKNYERLLLTLSPSSLDSLIASALEKNAIDLAKSESTKTYDSIWNRLKKQHLNFVRWNV